MFNKYPVNPILLSPSGHTFSYILANPGCILTEIAEAFGLSTRAIRGHVAKLEQKDLIKVKFERDRWAHYHVVMDTREYN